MIKWMYKMLCTWLSNQLCKRLHTHLHRILAQNYTDFHPCNDSESMQLLAKQIFCLHHYIVRSRTIISVIFFSQILLNISLHIPKHTPYLFSLLNGMDIAQRVQLNSKGAGSKEHFIFIQQYTT